MNEQGMCGARSPETSFGGREVCVLQHGHSGWHQAAELLTKEFGLIEPLRWGLMADCPAATVESGE